MCWIVLQLQGDVAIESDKLEIAWADNSHGGGFMYCQDGKLVITKGFTKLKEFKAAYYAAHSEHGAVSPFALHFRWATHGTRGADNMHPFPLADGSVGLMHNGILSVSGHWKDERSDTRIFCDTVLAHRTADFLVSDTCREWLEPIIGPSNKFVLLDSSGRWQIVNCNSGITEGARWYSNASHIPIVRTNKQASVTKPKTNMADMLDLGWDMIGELEEKIAGLEWDYDTAAMANNFTECERILAEISRVAEEQEEIRLAFSK